MSPGSQAEGIEVVDMGINSELGVRIGSSPSLAPTPDHGQARKRSIQPEDSLATVNIQLASTTRLAKSTSDAVLIAGPPNPVSGKLSNAIVAAIVQITTDEKNAAAKPVKSLVAKCLFCQITHENSSSSRKTPCGRYQKLRFHDLPLEMSSKRIPCSSIGSLYAGSVFRGEQRSGSSSYAVQVVIKVRIRFFLVSLLGIFKFLIVLHLQQVNFEDSFLCGYLSIHGLTDDYPELTTFFEAEIIGSNVSFLTKKWTANENIDLQHWVKFPGFKKYASNFNSESFRAPDPLVTRDFAFMRWKEQFLVPDHKISSISGASFSGFYYICCDLVHSTIQGYYYHNQSEWFQQLNLVHVPQNDRGSFEFR